MQERSDDTGATYMPRLLSLMNADLPEPLNTRADELTEPYSKQLSATWIEKLGATDA